MLLSSRLKLAIALPTLLLSLALLMGFVGVGSAAAACPPGWDIDIGVCWTGAPYFNCVVKTYDVLLWDGQTFFERTDEQAWHGNQDLCSGGCPSFCN